ncbi:YicC/YloC family endoribonuclease [Halovulum sp. GXIMD14793]
MTLSSMTGFATRPGTADEAEWVWEARSVNSRGLDIRLRLPEGLEGLEPDLRKQIAARLKRGAVTVSLRINLRETASEAAVNTEALNAALAGLQQVEAAAQAAGLSLAPTQAASILTMRGVMDQSRNTQRLAACKDAVKAEIAPLLDALVTARQAEGKAIGQVLSGQVDHVAELIGQATKSADARAAQSGATLKARVAALLDTTDRVDQDRLAQELALIAVKADVTEELDRLKTHVDAARSLLADAGPIGRKLDFLMQEFNREANTLCSKSGDPELTATGLEMKVTIDQMREQCQNIE